MNAPEANYARRYGAQRIGAEAMPTPSPAACTEATGLRAAPGTGRATDLEPDHAALVVDVGTPLVGEELDQVETAPALTFLIHIEPRPRLASRRSGVADLDAEYAVGGFGQRHRHDSVGEASRVRVADRVADQLAGEQDGVLDDGALPGEERASDEHAGLGDRLAPAGKLGLGDHAWGRHRTTAAMRPATSPL